MSPPLVSVIIPVYNGEAFLEAAIASALAQTYQPTEVIVVDDGSTDASAKIAARHDVQLLRRTHRGVSAACNAGVAAARGEMVAFLGCDDLWPPDRIALQADHLQRRPHLGFVMGHAIQFRQQDADHPRWLTDEWMARVHAAGRSACAPAGPGVTAASAPAGPGETAPVPMPLTLLARAEVFGRVGGFDEGLDIGEDLDWLMRATDAGVRHELLPDVVLHHRLHATNASYRLGDAISERLRIARRSVRRKRGAPAPSVSVVVPVRDGARFLREAILSALAQSHRPLEIVVVDDASRDGSADIAQGLGARVVRSSRRGVSAARNAGIAAARGELIALLDSDDRWPRERLALQVDALRRHPELGFVIGRARMFLEPGTPPPGWFTDELADGASTLARGTILARRDVLERIGGFDESADVCEDLDWLVRARDAQIPYQVLDSVVLEYRVHGANTGLPRRRDLEQGVFRTLRSSVERKRAAVRAP